MKTCYKNTPIKNRMKKRNSILTCAIILVIGCVLSDCSMSKEDTGKEVVETEDIKETEDISGRSEPEDVQMEQASVDDPSAGDDAPEETMMLTFMKGGEQEQKQAALTVSSLTVKGLSDTDEKKVEDGWKVQSYGVE